MPGSYYSSVKAEEHIPDFFILPQAHQSSIHHVEKGISRIKTPQLVKVIQHPLGPWVGIRVQTTVLKQRRFGLKWELRKHSSENSDMAFRIRNHRLLPLNPTSVQLYLGRAKTKTPPDLSVGNVKPLAPLQSASTRLVTYDNAPS